MKSKKESDLKKFTSKARQREMIDNLPLPDDDAIALGVTLLARRPLFAADSSKEAVSKDLCDMIAAADAHLVRCCTIIVLS